jgi:disulfide bond formation protein DsbB
MTPRLANFLGFCACAGLLGYAYFAQYHLHLEPCPLCILQRIGVFLTGIVFLVAALHGAHRSGAGRRYYAVIVLVPVLATAAVSIRQLYIQSLPPDSVPSCGASVAIMLKFMSVTEVLTKILQGSGECAKIDWQLFGLAMPAWVLIAVAGLGAWGVWANGRRGPPRVAFR